MLGTPSKLSSQFRLTFNMILQLLRVCGNAVPKGQGSNVISLDGSVTEMMRKSFGEYGAQSMIPVHEAKLAQLLKELEAAQGHWAACPSCLSTNLELYLSLMYQSISLAQSIFSEPKSKAMLTPGRVLLLHVPGAMDWYARPAVVLAKKLRNQSYQQVDARANEEPDEWFVLVCETDRDHAGHPYHHTWIQMSLALHPKRRSHWQIESIDSSQILVVTTLKLSIPFDVASPDLDQRALDALGKQLMASLSKPADWKELDIPKPRSIELDLNIRQRSRCLETLTSHAEIDQLRKCPDIYDHASSLQIVWAGALTLFCLVSQVSRGAAVGGSNRGPEERPGQQHLVLWPRVRDAAGNPAIGPVCRLGGCGGSKGPSGV